MNGQAVLKPRMTPVDVTLARGGSTQMASVDDKRGHVVKQSWPFDPLPEPVVAGNTATYASVLPGVDLIQVSHKTGVSQVLRIATAEAAKDPRVVQMRIFLDAQNATVQAEPGGGLTATGTDTGKTELRTAMGQWWDSSQSGASASDPGGPGITRPFSLSLGSENGKQTQVLGMSEILNLPNLHYPLFVDPDWSAARASYLYVDSAYPDTSYWNGQYTDSTVHVGYLPAAWAPDGVSHTTRGYYQFTTSPMSGKVILGAVMNATETWASSCTATPVDAWVTGGISPGTTWNAQPGLAVASKVDSRTVAMGYPGCAAGTVGFNMGAAKNIISTVGQWTVSLRAGNEGDPLGWKRFNNDASIIVTYDTPPYTPGLWNINNARWTGAPFASTYVTRMDTPIYTLTVGDPDGAAGQNINIWMTVFSTGISPQQMFSTGPISQPGSGGYPSWTSPHSLADGVYQLQAQAQDAQGVNSGVMQFFFEVKTTAPAAPDIIPPNTISTVPGTTTGTVNNGGKVGADQYAFSINDSGTYPAQGFVYAVTDGNGPSSVPTTVSCNTRVREFVVVCPSDGRKVTATVTPVDATTMLTVWAFDYAGNVNNQTKSTAPTSFTFTTGAAAATPVTILPATAQGASWVDVATSAGNPDRNLSTSCQDSLNPAATETGKALQLTGAAQYAATGQRAVDTSQSFSVSGWFCPSPANPAADATVQSLITQLAGPTSPGGAIRMATSSHLPEIDAWAGTNGTGLESVQSPFQLPVNLWTFVSAVYDTINQQLRITVSSAGSTTTWTYATATQTHIAAPVDQPVLLGASSKSGGGQFIGRIMNPVVAQGVLTAYQFNTAHSTFKSIADTTGAYPMGVLK